jgi:hypothetical protein
MPLWLTDIVKEVPKALIQGVVTFLGLGGLTVGIWKLYYGNVSFLANIQTTLWIALILITLSYLLGRVTGKRKWLPTDYELSIIENPLIQIGQLKWELTRFSDGSFLVDTIPFCCKHDMRLVEHWPMYFCPLHNDCHTEISESNLQPAHQSAHSIIEAELRKRKQV